jgi:hypothetical protein
VVQESKRYVVFKDDQDIGAGDSAETAWVAHSNRRPLWTQPVSRKHRRFPGRVTV